MVVVGSEVGTTWFGKWEVEGLVVVVMEWYSGKLERKG
jgi:hypothetical protein